MKEKKKYQKKLKDIQPLKIKQKLKETLNETHDMPTYDASNMDKAKYN